MEWREQNFAALRLAARAIWRMKGSVEDEGGQRPVTVIILHGTARVASTGKTCEIFSRHLVAQRAYSEL